MFPGKPHENRGKGGRIMTFEGIGFRMKGGWNWLRIVSNGRLWY
jgi:hypothetical protein